MTMSLVIICDGRLNDERRRKIESRQHRVGVAPKYVSSEGFLTVSNEKLLFKCCMDAK